MIAPVSSTTIQIYPYLALFISAMVEGPLVMMAAGFFLHLGYLELLPAYTALLAGDLAADGAWYWIGYFGAQPLVSKYGRFLSLSDERVNKILWHFRKHLNKILFLSKITMGLGFSLVVLVTAGIARISFTRFITLNLLGGLLWTSLLVSLGYFFGNVYHTIAGDFRLLFIAALAVIVLLAIFGFSRFMHKKFL